MHECLKRVLTNCMICFISWLHTTNLSSCFNLVSPNTNQSHHVSNWFNYDHSELCQCGYSVLSGRLIIKLSNICSLCTCVDPMIIQQRFNVVPQLQFYNNFSNVLPIIFKSFPWHFKDLWTSKVHNKITKSSHLF